MDVDRWTVSFLEHWLGHTKSEDSKNSQDKNESRDSNRQGKNESKDSKNSKDKNESVDFVRAVAQRRRDFTRLANSAATVVYGLPAFYGQE